MRRTARRELISAALLALVIVGCDSAAPRTSEPRETPVPAAPVSAAPDVVDYDLDATLDPAEHVVRGEGTIRWRNVSEKAVSQIWVHLYMNAFKDDRTVFRRERVSGFRGARGGENGSITVSRFFVKQLGRDVWPTDPTTPGDPNDATDIRVDLGAPIEPGAEIEVEVAFETKLPSVALRAGFAGTFHMAGQWFPKIAKIEKDGTFAHFPYERLSEFYSDFGTYRVTVAAPDAFVVGATGVRTAKTSEGGTTRHTYEQRGVHDFAFTAWDEFQERERDAGGVKIRCLFPPGLDASADVEMDAAERGLAFYGDAYGPYPYETLTIVHPPAAAAEAGGMEYPTLITTGGSFWLAHVPALALEHLTLHELAHQWFYGMVATNENAFPFLDEGLTTYATGEAARALYPRTLTPLLPVEIEALDRATRPHMALSAPVASRAMGFPTGGDYSGLVYARTATILRTIDRVWDGAARKALHAYAREWRFRHPKPADLTAAIRQAGGDAPADMFDLAIHRMGWVDYEPAALWNEGTDDGNVAHVTVRRRGTLEIPVDIELVDEAGAKVRLTWDGKGSFARLTQRTQARAVSVIVDPDGKILVDEDRANDMLSNEPDPSAPRSLTVTALLGALWLTVSSP
jgi:hypothetical protein